MIAPAVGIALVDDLLTGDPRVRRRLVERVEQAGLDHLTVGDHVSFHDGTGFDGIVGATAALATSATLPVLIGVYLLGLRHPLLAARSVSSLAQLAPGRLILGVGVGGEDRREISNSGVDPASRGRRLDETLSVVTDLLAGKSVTHAGPFFSLTDAAIRPVPQPPVPIVVGGRGEAAVRRTARWGDGWLGLFCSARRYAQTVAAIEEAAADVGRAPRWRGLTIWCGFGPSEASARQQLSSRMQQMYRVPGDRFRHVTAAGSVTQVADGVAAFVAVGARHITIVPAADTTEAAVDKVGEVRQLLLDYKVG